jgi:hypothetical protein
MAEKKGNWIWNLLRGKKRKELDRLERDLVKLPGERREYVGDPNTPEHMSIKTRN